MTSHLPQRGVLQLPPSVATPLCCSINKITKRKDTLYFLGDLNIDITVTVAPYFLTI